jgi:nicotinamidase/pyrazinamidase
MSKALIVVDMQNDFLTGSLANPAACEIIPNIRLEENKDEYDFVIFTKDTHQSDYLQTPEGKHLPIEHCIEGTWGHQVTDELLTIHKHLVVLNKPTFGSLELYKMLEDVNEVTLVGTCTDICVVSNALILKAALPELVVNVKADCCAGTTPENHEAALKVMKSCQINII